MEKMGSEAGGATNVEMKMDRGGEPCVNEKYQEGKMLYKCAREKKGGKSGKRRARITLFGAQERRVETFERENEKKSTRWDGESQNSSLAFDLPFPLGQWKGYESNGYTRKLYPV